MRKGKKYKAGETIPADTMFINYRSDGTIVITKAPYPTEIYSSINIYKVLDFGHLPSNLEIDHWYIMTDRDDGGALLLQYNGDDRPTVDLDGDDAAMPNEYEIGEEWARVKS